MSVMPNIMGWMHSSRWTHRCGDAVMGAASKVSDAMGDEAYDTVMSPNRGCEVQFLFTLHTR